MLGKILTYKGTRYKIKEETDTALCVGSNALQELWVSKAQIKKQEFSFLIGRAPASLLLS